MKKSLLALAALTTLSGAALAQSSVTLYGVADVAVGKTNAVGLGLANDKFQAIASNTLNNGTARWGLRGTEDLGGGLKAGFNFEAGLSMADGTGNLSGGTPFARAANMSLMGGFGELRAGRSLTTSFYSLAAWELTGTANYSVVGAQFGFVGAGPRDSAAIMYFSPKMGGLQINASTVLKGNNAASKSKYDLGAIYGAGPLTVSAAYNKVQDGNEGMMIGGKYNFGGFAVAGGWQSYETDAGVTINEGFSIGVSAPMGPLTLTADLARDTEYKDTNFLLEAKYALSKRTFIYGVYMSDGDGKGAATKNINGYSLGVRHNF